MASSSAHLSKKLKELIRNIGETKSKQEDRIILNELQELKTKMAKKISPPKKSKNTSIRALYIEMLGYSAPFAHPRHQPHPK